MSTSVSPESRSADARILAAARDAFVAGDGDIEMADVARRASVSTGLAYHYFGSKAGLLTTLIADFYDRYHAIVNARYDEGMSWPEREFQRLAHVVEFLFADPLAPIVLGRLSGNAQVVGVEAARREAIIELAERNIRDGQKQGQIDARIDPGIAGAAINGGLRQAIALALSRPGSVEPAEFTRQAWGLIAGALALPDRRPAEPLDTAPTAARPAPSDRGDQR